MKRAARWSTSAASSERWTTIAPNPVQPTPAGTSGGTIICGLMPPNRQFQEFPPPGPLPANERNLDRSDSTSWGPTRRRNHEARNFPHVVRFVDRVIGIDTLLGDDRTVSPILAIQDRLPAKRTG